MTSQGIPSSTPPPEATKAASPGPRSPGVSRTLDLPPDGSQISELGGAIAAALGSDDQKVESLRREVSTGEYVVDPLKIAEKMLRTDNSD